MEKEKTKILMYGCHIAYIETRLLRAFDGKCPVMNFSAWIREKAHEDFGLTITNAQDIRELDTYVSEHFYADKTDWLRDKLRTAIKLSKA